jgi:hypothetical protein
LDVSSPELIVEKLLEEYKNSPVDARSKAKEQIAISLAKASALDYGNDLKQEENRPPNRPAFCLCNTQFFTRREKGFNHFSDYGYRKKF